MDEDVAPLLITETRLLPVREQLLGREPLFHHRDLVGSREDFDRETAPDFWEVGASGRRYGREFVWATLQARIAETDQDAFVTEGWQVRDGHVREIADDTYLLTYTLEGPGDRLTRRLTVWQGSAPSDWRALYHQGTLVEHH